MSAIQDVQSKAMYTRLFDVLTDGTRQRIVRILLEQPGPLSEEELAERLADANDGEDSAASADRIRVRLHHLHLPKLADNGIVAWDETEGTVSPTDRPAAGLSGLDDLVAVDDGGSIASALADDRRRAVLAIADSECDPVDREELARTLASSDDDRSTTDVHEVLTKLHHHHLPKLDDAGLVDYDAESGSVAATAPPEVTALLPTVQ